ALVIGYFFLATSLMFPLANVIYYPYPQWKKTRLHEVESQGRIIVDEALGWWGSSSVHLFLLFLIPVFVGLFAGYMGGLYSRRILKTYRAIFAFALARPNG